MKIDLGGTAHNPGDIQALHELGLKFAEIPIVNPDEFHDLKEIYLRLKERTGIYYLCHGPREGNSNNIPLLENIYLPKLIEVIKIMPELDMDLLTIHLWLDPRFVTKKVIEYKTKLLKALVETAGDSGITVCLENLSERASDLEYAFETLPLLGLTLDLGHAQLLSPVNNSFSFIARYPDRIRHIHLHDNRGGNSAKEDLHLPVGKGDIDFDEIFKKLEEIRYNRTIALELKPKDIRKCINYVKRLLHDTP